MIYNILLIVQILVALGIIGLVLIQHGKGADAGAAFGGGSSGTVFGSAGAGNFLSRATAVLAAVFFANSLALAWIVSHSTGEAGSLVDSVTPTPTTKIEAPVSDVPGGTAVPQQAVPVTSDVPTGDVPQQSKPTTSNSTPTVPTTAPVPAKVEAVEKQSVAKPKPAETTEVPPPPTTKIQDGVKKAATTPAPVISKPEPTTAEPATVSPETKSTDVKSKPAEDVPQ
ncbi:MAG TPA: preprotein translocase subunit SecG [Thiothrix sp.]|nr:preprotein translocase subunit SecG [Thiothrix sp.]